MRTVRVKILDEANAAILGLYDSHLEWFFNHYGKRTENYFFQKKYKLGLWDGQIRFFKKTGKTYVALLPEIIKQLQALGYKLKLEDHREYGVDVDLINENHFAHIPHPDSGDPFLLRYYQVEGTNALIKNGGGICIAGTGAGKTLMNAVLVDQYGKQGMKSITIVPSTDLILQTKNDFIMWGMDTGEYSGDCKDTTHQHTVSTWQALQYNPMVMNQFDVVVVDEAHGLKGDVLAKLLNEHGKNIKYRFGLTGTLPKGECDAMSVRVAVGDVQYEIPAHQLMDEGYLSKMKITMFQLEENFKEQYEEMKQHNPLNAKMTYRQFKDSFSNEWSEEKRYLQSYKPRMEWIAECITALSQRKQGNVLCLITGIPFGKKLTKMIPGAIFVHGKDKNKVRKEIYDLFEHHDNLIVIASIQIASTGLNIPRIFNLVFVDVGKSYIRVIQSIGRGLRKAIDKAFVNVTDICSDLKYSRAHTTKRVNYYKESHYNYKKHIVKYDE